MDNRSDASFAQADPAEAHGPEHVAIEGNVRCVIVMAEAGSTVIVRAPEVSDEDIDASEQEIEDENSY